MPILRNRTQGNFTMVDNGILHDKSLSFFDRGVLITILSLPDKWDFSINGLSKLVPDGRCAITNSINRLVDKHYLRWLKDRNGKGEFDSDIEVFPVPNIEDEECVHCRFSEADNPKRVNRNGRTVTDNRTEYKKEIKETNIKTDNSKSINLSSDIGENEMIDVREMNSLIATNIELNSLIAKAESINADEVKMVNEVYGLICDMVNNPRNKVKIKGVEYSWDDVRDRFMKLNYQHVAAIMNRIVDKDLHIKDMSQYLISALFVEAQVGTLTCQAEIHDDYLKIFRGNPY